MVRPSRAKPPLAAQQQALCLLLQRVRSQQHLPSPTNTPYHTPSYTLSVPPAPPPLHNHLPTHHPQLNIPLPHPGHTFPEQVTLRCSKPQWLHPSSTAPQLLLLNSAGSHPSASACLTSLSKAAGAEGASRASSDRADLMRDKPCGSSSQQPAASSGSQVRCLAGPVTSVGVAWKDLDGLHRNRESA